MKKHFEVVAFRPKIKQFACIFSDITARKHAEAEQDKLQGQLQQAQKMESVGRLAGGVAHDFNNMLGVIIGHADLAVAQLPPDQPVQASLTEIREAAVRSANLTRQLLAFARKQIIEPKVLDLNETVEGMLKMLHRLIGEDVQLNWQPGLKLWPVNMDPSQVDQILANLCVNARDAIAGVGKVFIETGNSTFDEVFCAIHTDFVPGDYVRLFVSDSGCGMDMQTQSHLFEPFFTTKDPGKGTGLGLATVYGIVKQNKGLISVYSEPGHGTTFKIYLPRHMGDAAPVQGQAPAQPDAHGTETILLVEDEPTVLALATAMLKQLGYTVLTAGAPDNAIKLARDHVGPVHLLITDVIMPGMDGQSLAKELLVLYPHIRRLFMSGYTADVIAHHGVLDRGVHFIQKPFDIKALAAKIRAVLDEK
jgi:signal transduction histidine kinase/CheY-like chemotaxis protein